MSKSDRNRTTNPASKSWALLSASRGINPCDILNQCTENHGNLFEFSGFVQEEIGAGGEALLAVLGIREVRANHHVEIRMVWTNRTEDVKTGTSGHFQVENNSVWAQLLDAAYRLGYVARVSHELDARYVSQDVGQPLDDCG
jgi:hypothetical protein